MRFLGNKNLSHFLTLMFLALWHGIFIGYFISFAMEFLTIIMEKQVRDCSSIYLVYNLSILANRPDLIRTVLIFDLQNLRKSGRPDFPEFQPVTILVIKIIILMSFLCKLRRNLLY